MTHVAQPPSFKLILKDIHLLHSYTGVVIVVSTSDDYSKEEGFFFLMFF